MNTRRDFLKAAGAGAAALAAGQPFAAPRGRQVDSPNVLIITTDDMNWDSAGAFGNPIPNITPHIDRLAEEGMRFGRAHVTTPVCVPAREAMFSGTWPHKNGSNAGFFALRPEITTLHEQMKAAGYFIGQVGKEHLNPGGSFPKDYRAGPQKDLRKGRFPGRYRTYTEECLEAAHASGRPFFVHVGIMDPHRPFAGRDHLGPEGEGALRGGNGPPAPFSRKIRPEEVPLPPYADLIEGDARAVLADYYTSVHRADESVGAVMAAFRQSEYEKENTVVIFITDHGWLMADRGKLTLYPDGTRSALIVRWPGVATEGAVDREHFINLMDLTPTVIDISGAPESPDVAAEATSFRPLLEGASQDGRERVFTELNGGYGDAPMRFFQPERAVQDARRLYYFRPHLYDGAGTRMHDDDNQAPGDEQVEELYDLTRDPHAAGSNLAADPEHRQELRAYRARLLEHLRRTDDPAAWALARVDSRKALAQFMAEQRRLVKTKSQQ